MTDRQMITDTKNWPTPQNGDGTQRYCCMKNYDIAPRGQGGMPSLEGFGMLVAVNEKIVCTDGDHPNGITVIREDLDPLTYESVDAMLAAGWVVD